MKKLSSFIFIFILCLSLGNSFAAQTNVKSKNYNIILEPEFGFGSYFHKIEFSTSSLNHVLLEGKKYPIVILADSIPFSYSEDEGCYKLSALLSVYSDNALYKGFKLEIYENGLFMLTSLSDMIDYDVYDTYSNKDTKNKKILTDLFPVFVTDVKATTLDNGKTGLLVSYIRTIESNNETMSCGTLMFSFWDNNKQEGYDLVTLPEGKPKDPSGKFQNHHAIYSGELPANFNKIEIEHFTGSQKTFNIITVR